MSLVSRLTLRCSLICPGCSHNPTPHPGNPSLSRRLMHRSDFFLNNNWGFFPFLSFLFSPSIPSIIPGQPVHSRHPAGSCTEHRWSHSSSSIPPRTHPCTHLPVIQSCLSLTEDPSKHSAFPHTHFPPSHATSKQLGPHLQRPSGPLQFSVPHLQVTPRPQPMATPLLEATAPMLPLPDSTASSLEAQPSPITFSFQSHAAEL